MRTAITIHHQDCVEVYVLRIAGHARLIQNAGVADYYPLAHSDSESEEAQERAVGATFVHGALFFPHKKNECYDNSIHDYRGEECTVLYRCVRRICNLIVVYDETLIIGTLSSIATCSCSDRLVIQFDEYYCITSLLSSW